MKCQNGEEKWNKHSKKKSIVRQLIFFSKKHRKIMQYQLEKTGVFQAQHHILMEISRNPNISQKDLALALEVSTATIAVSLKKLEHGGYINRSMDQSDNRLNQINITDKGHQVVEMSKQIFHSCDEKIFEGFTEDELETLSVLLKRMDDNLTKLETDKIDNM